jgi:ParB family chromosome partitioning protein
VSNTLRLLNLPPSVQRRVAAGVLTAGHARALLALDDHAAQERLAERVVAEGLSVRSVEELVTVGDTAAPPVRAARAKRAQPAELDALAELLSEALDTRVKIELGRNRGKLVVEFATMEDLERVLGQLAPGALQSAEQTESPESAQSAESAEPTPEGGERRDEPPAPAEQHHDHHDDHREGSH